MLSARSQSSSGVPAVEVMSDGVFHFRVEEAIKQSHAETLKYERIIRQMELISLK